MTDCPLQLNADGHWQCPQCNWVYPLKSDNPPHRNCMKAPSIRLAAKKLHVTWEDATHYAHAIVKWQDAGFPMRTRAEVARCFWICKGGCGNRPCKWYANGYCKLCHCRVNQSRIALMNKIKMRTESCPEGKW